jgi:four helix bundle protein
MQTYKELITWQKAIELTIEVYRITRLLPAEEKFGLVSQMNRAAVSIPSNIAEGFARCNKKENAYFVNIAYGSAMELETQLIIVKKLNLLVEEQFLKIDSLLEEIAKLLYKYRDYLKN